jgi:ribosomal protein L37E
MSKNKVCPECHKGVLHKREYQNEKGNLLIEMYCSMCGYEEKQSNIRDMRWTKKVQEEEE